jgi:hypothetical protein
MLNWHTRPIINHGESRNMPTSTQQQFKVRLRHLAVPPVTITLDVCHNRAALSVTGPAERYKKSMIAGKLPMRHALK